MSADTPATTPRVSNDPRKWAAYGICDAGRGNRRQHDPTAIAIFTTGPESRVFLVDAVLDRIDPGERGDIIVRLIRKWKPVRFIYEEMSFMSDTFYINERFEREQIDLRLIHVGGRGPRHTLSKHDRIVQLAEWFRQGRIVLPRQLLYRQVDGKVIDLVHHFIHEQYLPYRGPGSIAHDDLIDCFSRLLEPELRLEYLDRGDEDRDDEDERWATTGKGSWESIW